MDKHLCCPPCKLLGTILEMDQGRNQINGPEDKKTNAKGLASERQHILHVSRKERGRGLASIEDSVDASIRGFENYIKKRKERLITAVNNSADHIKSREKQ